MTGRTVRIGVFEVLILAIPVVKCLALPVTIKLGARPGLWYLFNWRMIGGSVLTTGLSPSGADNIGAGLWFVYASLCAYCFAVIAPECGSCGAPGAGADRAVKKSIYQQEFAVLSSVKLAR
jgi:hypothetical protein